MSLISGVRNYFYRRTLQQNGMPRPQRAVINLQDAITIGMLYNASDPDHDIIVTKFAEMLRAKGKTVEIMAFINDKKIERKGDIEVFNPKSVNWYGIPLDARVGAFCTKNFDLLLCAFINESKPLEYMAYMSKARYRVGPFEAGKTRYFDLMIDLGRRKDLSYMLQQAVHFLENIKYN